MRTRVSSGTWVVVALAATFLGLRLPALDADLSARLSAHFQDVGFTVFDEGWWTANARESVLFGRTLGTGFDLVWVSPVFTAFERLAFGIGSVSLATARAASVVAGLVGALVLLAMDRGSRASRLAAFLAAVSFAGAQLGRLALPETLGTTLGLAGAACLARRVPLASLWAGVFAALATLTKPHFAVLIPSFALATILLARSRREKSFPAVAGFLAASLGVLAVWAAFAFAHRAAVSELLRFYGSSRWFARPAGVVDAFLDAAKPFFQVAFLGLASRHSLFANVPFAFTLVLLALPIVAMRAWRLRPALSDAAIVMMSWALVGGVAIALLPFQPLRYWMPLAPSFYFLAAWWMTERAPAALHDEDRAPRLFHWVAAVALFSQIIYAALDAILIPRIAALAGPVRVWMPDAPPFHLASFLVELARDRSLAPFTGLPQEHAILAASAFAAALAFASAVMAATLGLGLWMRAIAMLERRLPTRLILVLWIAFEALLWAQWNPTRSTSIRDLGRTLSALLPADAVVSPAGTYSLESRLAFDSRAVRDRRMFDATGAATHFLVLAEHPLVEALPEDEIERRWPGSERLATFTLTGGFVYRLYRAARPPSGVGPDVGESLSAASPLH